MKKVPLRKGLIQNGSTDRQKIIKVHLIRPGMEDCEVGEVPKERQKEQSMGKDREWGTNRKGIV